MVSRNTIKFGGHKHSGSGDITVFVCHEVSQDYVSKTHVTLRARVSNGKSPFSQVWWPKVLG